MKSVTLGVLVCDAVKPELQSLAGDYPTMFRSLFRKHTPEDMAVNLRFFDVRANQYPEDIRECDGYLSTGSAASVNDPDPWVETFAEFVRCLHSQQAKLFAICFGHQMIAKALGGKVEIAAQRWGVGIHLATVLSPKPWMIPAANTFRLIGSHQEQITALPSGAEVLASSAHCPNAMIQCGSLIGVQGHPEFPANYAQALMESRAEIIPASTREKAKRSFVNATPDAGLLVSWIVNYVSRS